MIWEPNQSLGFPQWCILTQISDHNFFNAFNQILLYDLFWKRFQSILLVSVLWDFTSMLTWVLYQHYTHRNTHTHWRTQDFKACRSNHEFKPLISLRHTNIANSRLLQHRLLGSYYLRMLVMERWVVIPEK